MSAAAKIWMILFAAASILALPGCKNRIEKLDDLCAEIGELAKSDDCRMVSKEIDPLMERFKKLSEELDKGEYSQEERDALRKVGAQCAVQMARLAMSPCGAEAAVSAAVNNLGD